MTTGDTPNSDLLTPDEHEAMALSGKLAGLLRRIIGDGPCSEGDWQEACHRIHSVQQMILSQAAGRAYPDRYRLLGGPLCRDPDPKIVGAYCTLSAGHSDWHECGDHRWSPTSTVGPDVTTT